MAIGSSDASAAAAISDKHASVAGRSAGSPYGKLNLLIAYVA